MKEESFEDAFFWALWYNGWHEHVDAMREYLMDPSNREENGFVLYPDGRSACITDADVKNDNPNSILWMCLVTMFGNCITSPRYGWIERPDEACEWLLERQRSTYHEDWCWDDDGDTR